jgi:hypothetical protein
MVQYSIDRSTATKLMTESIKDAIVSLYDAGIRGNTDTVIITNLAIAIYNSRIR